MFEKLNIQTFFDNAKHSICKIKCVFEALNYIQMMTKYKYINLDLLYLIKYKPALKYNLRNNIIHNSIFTRTYLSRESRCRLGFF